MTVTVRTRITWTCKPVQQSRSPLSSSFVHIITSHSRRIKLSRIYVLSFVKMSNRPQHLPTHASSQMAYCRSKTRRSPRCNEMARMRRRRRKPARLVNPTRLQKRVSLDAVLVWHSISFRPSLDRGYFMSSQTCGNPWLAGF